MAWDWVAPAGTVVVALAGIGATLCTAAQGRKHAEHLATEGHDRAHEEVLRQERLKVYSDALAHAVAEERKLDAVWVVMGDRRHNFSAVRVGGELTLSPMDAVSVKIHLLADDEVERAWASYDDAWMNYHWWIDHEHTGDPAEEAPSDVVEPLRGAIDTLKASCRRALE